MTRGACDRCGGPLGPRPGRAARRSYDVDAEPGSEADVCARCLGEILDRVTTFGRRGLTPGYAAP